MGLKKECFKTEETQACLLMGESRLRWVVKDTESDKDLLSKVPERWCLLREYSADKWRKRIGLLKGLRWVGIGLKMSFHFLWFRWCIVHSY